MQGALLVCCVMQAASVTALHTASACLCVQAAPLVVEEKSSSSPIITSFGRSPLNRMSSLHAEDYTVQVSSSLQCQLHLPCPLVAFQWSDPKDTLLSHCSAVKCQFAELPWLLDSFVWPRGSWSATEQQPCSHRGQWPSSHPAVVLFVACSALMPSLV